MRIELYYDFNKKGRVDYSSNKSTDFTLIIDTSSEKNIHVYIYQLSTEYEDRSEDKRFIPFKNYIISCLNLLGEQDESDEEHFLIKHERLHELVKFVDSIINDYNKIFNDIKNIK